MLRTVESKDTRARLACPVRVVPAGRCSSPSCFPAPLWHAASKPCYQALVFSRAAAGGPWSIPTLHCCTHVCGRGSDQLMPLKRPTWGATLARPRLLRRGGRQRRPTPGRNQRWAPSSPLGPARRGVPSELLCQRSIASRMSPWTGPRPRKGPIRSRMSEIDPGLPRREGGRCSCL